MTSYFNIIHSLQKVYKSQGAVNGKWKTKRENERCDLKSTQQIWQIYILQERHNQ